MTMLLCVTTAMIGLPLFGAWSSPEEAPRTWLANDLLHLQVNSPEGDELGKLEDIVVQPGGRTSYAVVSFGGWLGMGDKLFAMPWSLLRAVEPEATVEDGERSLVLLLNKERLRTAPGFESKSWPTMAGPDWTKDVDAFYLNDVKRDPRQQVDGASRTSVITWRVTELTDHKVQTPTGDKLGDIKHVAIDTNGRVSLVALSVGGLLGIGDKIVAVPWDTLEFSRKNDKDSKRLITLSSTKEQLEKAPEFKISKEDGPQTCDPKWIARVYEHFSCPAYWNVIDNTEVTLASGK